MALEKELATYLRERPGWVSGGLVGQWVVIHGDEVVGFFPTLDAALQAGYDRFGLDELFMARQIAEVDRPIHTSRRAIHVPHAR
jgi:hypothetical protein